MKRVLLSAVALLIACLSWENADAQRKPREVQEQAIKYQRLMQMIDAAYVDTVNLKKLTEDAIVKVLADLDPHSVYISKEEVEEANEPLDGGFFGIGIQFNVLNDTLLVVDVVAGGPSEKVGLLAGDRIIAVDGEKLIVYTDSPAFGRMGESSTPAGLFQDGRVVVLIDGNSASASEIVSGAVQDWDRGLIVGRRSFGKGLVQRQFPLTDGSMVRLTVSHYFTPSGRCIQKPYKGKDYQAEVFERYNSGEMFSADSIELTDSTKYYTKKDHRLVYGGGGIIPDVFVPIDTGINYSYFNRLLAKGVINEYVLNYVDKNRESLKKKYPKFEMFQKNFQVTGDMIYEIVKSGEKQGVKKDENLFTPIVPEIKLFVKSLIARDLWNMNELYRISNEENKILKAAVKALNDGTYGRIIK